MKKLCAFYVARAEFIGAFYCVLPTLAGFAYVFFALPFREVYLYRLAIAILVGAPAAAYLNRFGLSLWMIKHASPKGPGTILDGSLIGCFLGAGMAVIPAFTHFMSSSDLDRTKTRVIAIWLCAGLAGAIIGGCFAAIGKKHLDRQTCR